MTHAVSKWCSWVLLMLLLCHNLLVTDSMGLLFNVLLYARNGVIYTDLHCCMLCVVYIWAALLCDAHLAPNARFMFLVLIVEPELFHAIWGQWKALR
jgi:hypothetical protein